MASDLPTEFDVVVLGTGMPESIVAAACSRIGQAVLHIDRNEYYSGDWASFTLQGIEKWAKQLQDPEEEVPTPSVDQSSSLEEGETAIQLPLESANFSQIDMKYHVEEGEEIVDVKAVKPKPFIQIQPTDIKEIPPTDKRETDEGFDADLKDSVAPESTEQDIAENVNNIDIKDESSGVNETSEDNVEMSEEKNVTEGDNEINDKSKGDNEINDKSKGDNEIIDKSKGDDAEETKASCDENTCDKPSDEDNKGEEDFVKTTSKSAPVSDVGNNTPTIQPSTDDTQTKKWTINRLKAEWRKFNLDLSPKVIYSGGDMVELLISSDIAKYCEFKTITRMLTLLNNQLEKVPCSRADVFSSKKVSMIEKRMLMKFLQFCMEYENKREEVADFLQKPFTEFLAHRKLTANVKHYIQHSIAMATDSTTTEQGLQQMTKFIKSVGRYGNTAYLWSLYGSGELPQSFCRMCAVFGGLYCLRMPASSMIIDKDNRCTAIITSEGQKIKCKWLIMESSYAPPDYIAAESTRTISRAIIMTDKPLLPTDQQELSLMCLPCPDDGDRPIVVLELPPTSLACPKDTYIFHLTRKGSTNKTPEEDLRYAIDKLFKIEKGESDNTDQSSDKPTILWSLYFSQRDMSAVCPTERVPANVILMSGPGPEIDIDKPVREAKEVFKKILPEEEFLPKAPNPEDIIYVDDAEAQVAEDSSQSEFKDTDSQSDESTTGQATNEQIQNDSQSEAVSSNIPTNEKGAGDSQSEAGSSEIPTNEQIPVDSQSEAGSSDIPTNEIGAGDSQSGASKTDKADNEKGSMESGDSNKE